MPISTLDPHAALIVIDLQQGIVGIPVAHPIEGVIANSRRLIDAFRARNLPVVLVNVNGRPPGRTQESPGGSAAFPAGWDELIAELEPQPGDLLVTKQTRSAFPRTGLADRLKSHGVTQVFVAGVSTSGGVESTVRDAHEEGFHAVAVVDAMTDPTADRHEHSVTKIFPRIAETGTTDEILGLLDRIIPTVTG